MEEISFADIFFPVEEEKIYIKSGEKYKAAVSHKAIMDSNSKKLISVVSNSYKLISNEKAYKYGKKCVKELFEINNESDIILYNIISPKTFSFCHIDLICSKSEMKIIKDNYKQFVRVTNSYNTSYKLGFSIGFCRSICKNGIIFDKNSIDFKFSHIKNVNTEEIDFLIKKVEFENLKKKFVQDLEYLNGHKIEKKFGFALFCKALDIKFRLNGNSTDRQKKLAKEKLDTYQDYFYKKFDEYSKELGENLYSLFNVITDFSSNSDEINSSFTNTFNSNQRRAGRWLFDFIEHKKKGETIEKYLENYLYLTKN